jgi:rubrerythrin
MAAILVVDTVGDSRPAIEAALRGAGWEVTVLGDPMECCIGPADAVVVAADAAGLARVQQAVALLREQSDTPVILIIDLDRSGWDRTFGASGGLNVDALMDTPVNAHALVARLRGIFAARKDARQLAATPTMLALLARAIANEEASESFYRQAAERVPSPETRDALEMLAKEEREHKRMLEEFREGRRPLPSGSPQTASLAEAFGVPEFSTNMSPADAFLLAARKEQLAMQMYRNWAALYAAGPERDLLLQLAEMEGQHQAHVEAMFSDAAFPEVW